MPSLCEEAKILVELVKSDFFDHRLQKIEEAEERRKQEEQERRKKLMEQVSPCSRLVFY